MKIRTIALTITLLFIGLVTQAQILKKIGKRVEKAAERTVLNRTDKEVSEQTDKALDTILEGKKKKKRRTNSKNEQDDDHVDESDEVNTNGETVSNQQTAPWSQYNFVPGDEIIFHDDLVSEENGEFPSRWDLLDGTAENAFFQGENVINFKNKSIIIPLMDEVKYLPEVFTIEFDAYYDTALGDFFWQYYSIRFSKETGGWYYPTAGSKDYYYPLHLYRHGAKLRGIINGVDKDFKTYEESLKVKQPIWRHIAIAFNKRSLKVFVDQHRVLNIPNLGFKPQMFSIAAKSYDEDGTVRAIKNIRVAEGGKKLYDRVVAEGKFVTRGILFDVNKASIKKESMGVINEVAKMMTEHPDLNFSIEGHTDNDGADDYNLKLSEQRAVAVKEALKELGIDENRFQTKGLGESIPVSDNTSPEGKANNRRVEFVKI